MVNAFLSSFELFLMVLVPEVVPSLNSDTDDSVFAGPDGCAIVYLPMRPRLIQQHSNRIEGADAKW